MKQYTITYWLIKPYTEFVVQKYVDNKGSRVIDLISVIIPIYNGEKYLHSLVNSLQSQTYKKFEVLFVEDHSNDNSKQILENYAKNDSRFKILQPEKKMGTAVKGQEYALPFCIGDYHFFMSQDDFIDKDLFQKCIETFKEKNADIVIPNCILYFEDHQSKLGNYPIDNDYSKCINNRDAFLLSLYWKIHGFTMEKMSLFKKVGLKADYYNSEEYQKRLLFLNAESIYFADSNFYYRQDNPDAITKSCKYFHIDIMKTNSLLFEEMKKNRFEKKECRKFRNTLYFELLKWIWRGFKYKFFFGNKGFYLKRLVESFLLLVKNSF